MFVGIKKDKKKFRVQFFVLGFRIMKTAKPEKEASEMQNQEPEVEKIMGEISEKLNKLDGDPEWKQKVSNIVRRIILEYTA